MSDELPFATTKNLLDGASKQGVGPSPGRSHTSTPIPEGGDGAHGPQRHGAPREGEQRPDVAHTPPRAPVQPAAVADAPPRSRKRETIQRKPVSTRLSDTEKAEIASAARAARISTARFIAEAALARALDTTHPRADAADDALLEELVRGRTEVVRVGTLFNQVTHRLNAGGASRSSDAVLAEAVTAGVRACAAVIERYEAATDHRLGREATG
ncbi:hypothetical protein OG948_17455 [Embleya sp. NBC_00888]|uniref:plasmid mobilization protein n=1 Tax=Embleya sp. NBC_00888 TaxID=2975960 RepID=UPI00386E69FB|nr:hypothetical protein OG948_17455 [Embleya sp. NBC_00888]